jgi:hypothetical protein
VNPLFLASAFHLAHSAHSVPGELKLEMICMCPPGRELLSIEMRLGCAQYPRFKVLEKNIV